jgi:hypothetical protein
MIMTLMSDVLQSEKGLVDSGVHSEVGQAIRC